MDEMKTLTYNVIYEGDDAHGWSAFVPDLTASPSPSRPRPTSNP